MKQKNWALIFLVAGVVCFGAFGIYNFMAKDNGAFTLEDISGDRKYLNDFPLEGYGGDALNSLEFTLINGEMDVMHHSYGTNALRNIRNGEEIGQNEFLSYFQYAWDNDGSHTDTVAVPAEDAKVNYEKKPSISLFEEYTQSYRYGETITTDKIDIYASVLQIIGDDSFYAKYPTGLSIAESTVFTISSTAEKGSGTWTYQNSYDSGFIGEEHDIRKLKSYSADLGKEVFSVTVPDERCEGKTYIYRVTPGENISHRSYSEVGLEKYINDIRSNGTAEPFLPVPDPKVRRIVGLEGIGEEYLAVFLIEKDDFIAEIYDMDAKLIGTARKTLGTALDVSKTKDRMVEEYLRANQIDIYQVPFADGVSLHVLVTDRVVMEEEQEDYGSDIYDAVTARMLLWITPDGVVQNTYSKHSEITAIRGDKILLIDHAYAAEKEELVKVVDIVFKETRSIEVLDATSFTSLYKGYISSDFWQDDLQQLTKIDNAGGNAYIKQEKIYSEGNNTTDKIREVVECKPIGGRGGNTW